MRAGAVGKQLVADVTIETVSQRDTHIRLRRSLKATRQVSNLLSRLNLLSKGVAKPDVQHRVRDIAIKSIKAITSSFTDDTPAEKEVVALLADLDVHNIAPRHILRLRVLHEQFMQICRNALTADSPERLQQYTEKLAIDKNMEEHFRATRQLKSSPLTYVLREKGGMHGEMPGTFATRPSEIDQIITDAWTNVYAGYINDHAAAITSFIRKYESYIFSAAAADLNDITQDDILRECMTPSHSAAGMDGWTHGEWSLLPPRAAALLAKMLNLIERTGVWLAATVQAKATFLETYPDAPPTPLSARILLLLSTLYRKWASIRLGHLKAWISTWADSAMFVGIPGVGADDAWYNSAVDI